MKKQIWSLLCVLCLSLALPVFTACQSNSGAAETSGAGQESVAPQNTAEDTRDPGQETGGGEGETTAPDDEDVSLDELTPGDGSGGHDDGNWTNPY